MIQRLSALLAFPILVATSPAQCELIGLGTLGGSQSRPIAASEDGSVIVGTSTTVQGASRPFLWTEAGGMVDLSGGTGPLQQAIPVAVSADGNTVVLTRANSALDQRVLVWTAAAGTVNVGNLGGGVALVGYLFDQTSCVSADGSVVVGTSSNAAGESRPFRWTAATGIVDLGTLGGVSGRANAVSLDGTTVVGEARSASGDSTAFRWTAATGMQSIGPALAGGASYAVDVSADGAAVAIESFISSGSQSAAYVWSVQQGLQTAISAASGELVIKPQISGDGQTLAGTLDSTAGVSRPFIWSAAAGLITIDAYAPGFAFANGLSNDGRIVVGEFFGNDSGAFRAITTSLLPGTYAARVGDAETGALGISGDGQVIYGVSRFSPNSRRAVRWLASPLGQTVCASTVNSSECHGTLRIRGSLVASQNNLTLTASSLPVNSFGVFLASQTAADVVAAGSAGRLCLGGPLSIYRGPGQILDSGAAGEITLTLDLAAIPTPTGPVAALPGDSWIFQAWHRDAAPQATWNYTDAVRVTLE